MRRLTVGLFASMSLVALAGCATIPDGAAEAQALECPPGEEGCPEIRPVGPGGDLEVDMGEFWFEIVGGTPVDGEIVVTANSVESDYHNIEFLGAAEGSFLGDSDGRAVVGASGGESDEGTVELFAGEYVFICNVPGHRAAGMEATVTVYSTPEEAEAAMEESDDLGVEPAA